MRTGAPAEVEAWRMWAALKVEPASLQNGWMRAVGGQRHSGGGDGPEVLKV